MSQRLQAQSMPSSSIDSLVRQIRASLTQNELLSLSGNSLKSVGCAEKLLNFYFQVLMQIQVVRRSMEDDESQ